MTKLQKKFQIGLMGGTFNPIHLGHLRAAEEIFEYLGLDQLYFVPAAKPPHKELDPKVNYYHRLEMLKLAVSDRPGFWVSDIEARLSFPSYTINTLKAFEKERGEHCNFYFLVGMDAFLSILTWKDYKELFSLASFAIFCRAGTNSDIQLVESILKTALETKVLFDHKKECFFIEGFQPVYYRPSCKLEISSTDLRQRLETGKSVRYLVPEAVRIYIEENEFYLPSKKNHTKI